VKDVWPESWRSAVGNLVDADGTLMFTAFDPTVGDGRVPTIWQSDGTAAGTVRVARFPAGTELVSKLVPAGGMLFAVAYRLGLGTELWALDAGAAEARLVRDINPGSQDSSINSPTPLGGGVVFSADMPAAGYAHMHPTLEGGEYAPNPTLSFRLRLPPPGTYDFWLNLNDGQEELLRTTLVVTP
jgi:ELWxxDGT repeat protein